MPTLKHGVDHLECLIDLLAYFGASQDDFAAHEDQEHNLGLNHSVNETREQFRLVGAKHVMTTSQTFETNGKLDVARALQSVSTNKSERYPLRYTYHNVLDLEIGKLCVEAELLNDPSILARSQTRIVLGLCTSHDHLARSKDQSCSLGIANTHDDSRETLLIMFSTLDDKILQCGQQYLWIVFRITSVQRNRLEVQAAIEIDRGNDVS